jgi:hypothetical protein
VIGEVQRLIDQHVQIDVRRSPEDPRECSNIAFTMSAFAVLGDFFRLLVSMAERSSTSVR